MGEVIQGRFAELIARRQADEGDCLGVRTRPRGSGESWNDDDLFLQEAARQRCIARFPQSYNDNRIRGWPAVISGKPRHDKDLCRHRIELEDRHPISLVNRFIAWTVAHTLYALWLILGRRRI